MYSPFRAVDADVFDEEADYSEEEEEEDRGSWNNLSISRVQARQNYDNAGTDVPEPIGDIK